MTVTLRPPHKLDIVPPYSFLILQSPIFSVLGSSARTLRHLLPRLLSFRESSRGQRSCNVRWSMVRRAGTERNRDAQWGADWSGSDCLPVPIVSSVGGPAKKSHTRRSRYTRDHRFPPSNRIGEPVASSSLLMVGFVSSGRPSPRRRSSVSLPPFSAPPFSVTPEPHLITSFSAPLQGPARPRQDPRRRACVLAVNS